MSSLNDFSSRNQVVKFYRDHLEEFGDSSKGVGWKNDLAQEIRFDQLLKVIDKDNFTINDLGAGTGRLCSYLKENGVAMDFYYGYDVLEEMVIQARARFAGQSRCKFSTIQDPTEMEIADYTVASGIFNVKYDANTTPWENYICDTITEMNNRSKRGFSFNILSTYSDIEYRKDYLYYGDPLFYFDFCQRNFSRNVSLIHDYDQYDFTLIVRKNS